MTSVNLKKILFLLLMIAGNMPLSAQIKISTDTARIINIDKFNMPQLGRQRTIRVYLPKDYALTHKKYPVLYMLDGQNVFKSDAGIKNTWAIDSILNTLPANKQCIIVGVDHAGKDRITEYDPYNSTYGTGMGSAFTRFLAATLKPYIDSNYRTKTDARHTAIAGSSMGSLLAMYATVKYPDIFGSAGIFSPAFWIAPDIYTLTEAGSINKSGFYLTCGDKEGNEVTYVNKMDSVLHAKGLSLKQAPPTLVNIGAVHNETQWRAAFPAFYTWLTKRFSL